jgi:hypothetical protein
MLTERLSAVDAAWLRMDTPTNRMMITSVLTFDEALDVGAVTRLIEERLLRHERFRQRSIPTSICARTCITSRCRRRAIAPRWPRWSATSCRRRSIARAPCGRSTSSTAGKGAARRW